MNKDNFIEELKKIGITPTKDQLNKLDMYYHLLIEWNKKINLTRITEEKDVYLKHFYDSLTLYKVLDLNNVKRMLDFGTGAGFPGIVIKIFFPDIEMVLLDSLNKRLIFLEEVIKVLDLKKITLIHSRIEDYNDVNFDVITTRAVANLSKLLIYTKNLIKEDTKFVPMKASVDEEIIDAKIYLDKLNLRITNKESFNLPNNSGKRCILTIEKNKEKK